MYAYVCLFSCLSLCSETNTMPYVVYFLGHVSLPYPVIVRGGLLDGSLG
jgi:hypothetical protein